MPRTHLSADTPRRGADTPPNKPHAGGRVQVKDPHTNRLLILDAPAAQLDAYTALRVEGAVTPRLMGHVFSIGGDPALDGSLLKHTTAEMRQALSQLAASLPPGTDADLVDEVMGQLRRAGAWTAASATTLRVGPHSDSRPPKSLAAEIVATIRNGGRVLLPAPVCGSDGAHAMLVEVVPQGAARYTLRVFNSTYADTRQHALANGDALQTHTDFVDIPASAMHRLSYVQSLLQMGYTGQKPLREEINALYDWAAKYGVAAPASGEMQASQIVGNCAWKCLAGYARDRLPRPLYLRLKLEHRTRVLDDYARTFGVPALVTQMCPLYGAGYAWHAPLGTPVLTAVWTPVAYGHVPVGWTRTFAGSHAALLTTSRVQLEKTRQRYAWAVQNAGPGADPEAKPSHDLAPAATRRR